MNVRDRLTRRNFLKALGVAASAGAIGAVLPPAAASAASQPPTGVPSIDPNYVRKPDGTYDVEGWYASHPFRSGQPVNISSPALQIDATSYPLVSLPLHPFRPQDGFELCYDLQSAVNAAMAAGGGTVLMNGTAHPYGRATVLGQSHLHFRGNPTGGTVCRGIRLYGSTFARNYDSYAQLINVAHDAAATAALQNPTRDYYFKDIVFDAAGYMSEGSEIMPTPDQGNLPDWVCLGLYGVRDILAQDCTFRNMRSRASVATWYPAEYAGQLAGYKDVADAQWGFVHGIEGVTNAWFRSCVFHGSTWGQPGGDAQNIWPYAFWYLDGPRGCGVVDSRCEGYVHGNGFIVLTNDDFTADLDGDGSLGRDDLRDARYNVFDNIRSTADCLNPFTLFGYANLVQNCSFGGVQLRFCSIGSHAVTRPAPKGGWYRSGGNVIKNNRVAKLTTNADFDPVFVELDYGQLQDAGSLSGNNLVIGNVVDGGGPAYILKVLSSSRSDRTNVVSGNAPTNAVQLS